MVVKRTKGIKARRNKGAAVRFYQKPSCASCRKARILLEENGIALELRDLGKEPMSVPELDELIDERDHKDFLNTRTELYRARKMREKPPSRAEALRLMAMEPNLIRRPMTVRGKTIVLGYDPAKLNGL
jgi:Spx/MgsR family transcriptional regulator